MLAYLFQNRVRSAGVELILNQTVFMMLLHENVVNVLHHHVVFDLM